MYLIFSIFLTVDVKLVDAAAPVSEESTSNGGELKLETVNNGRGDMCK